VDDRTVKRELAKLKSLGWFNVKRNATRGRVAVYALDLQQVLLETRRAWDEIGPDFLARMETSQGIALVQEDSKVVPFKPLYKETYKIWKRIHRPASGRTFCLS
jgi:hypothetical protein